MNSPTHEAVAQRAREIWQKYGSPGGRDTEIWYEAERQLNDEHSQASNKTDPETATTRQIKRETAAESMVENHISPAIPDEEAIKAAMQRREARAPILPHTSAPKAKPPETGKPLWSKPHSS